MFGFLSLLRKDDAVLFKELFKIDFRYMIRKTAHGNALRQPDFTARECEIKLLRNCPRIFAHHLVKIADAQKRDRFRVELLRFQIPTIYRADRCALFGHFLFGIGLSL